jgi:DNA-directed RNA polymerase specialized sigma24 family protein
MTGHARSSRAWLPVGAGPGADQDKAMDTNPSRTGQTGRRSDDPVVTGLVTRARNGDKQAWDALVERHAPLIWSICGRHRLADADAEDVAQSVWLKLVDQLGRIRDPAALPGWLDTTTRRECDRILRAAPGPHGARYLPDAATAPDHHPQAAGPELVNAERHAALREAFASCPPVASNCSPCSPKTLRYRMPRSARDWASQWAASARDAAAAWTN